MDTGDILHYILILDAGVAPTISLVSTGDIANSEEAPDAVVALDASDITSSSFTANWHLIENASAYYLDVATDSAFTSFVAGYNNLSVGYVKEYPVVGLTDAYTYYYRVRGANHIGTGISSNTITTTTDIELVTDFDGNVYTYVTIGTQQWMVENFRSTKYADGTAIPNISNYNDWFLPSLDELQEMDDAGLLTENYYWSSSEIDANFAYAISTGAGTAPASKANTYAVKACRAFTSLTVYAVGDLGQAGGIIFWKSGNDYLEAAPSDQSISESWSNITTLLLGGTGTAIGTGQANTTAIIGQVGHTDSAAKLCDDLTSDMLWAADINGAYCYYNNDIANKADYGALYNWYAVDNAHGLAPAGWRVPTDTDWQNLIAFLGGEGISGGILKEIGINHWESPNLGATDEYGFSAEATGMRTTVGGFFAIRSSGYWWTSQDDGDGPIYYKMYNNQENIFTEPAGNATFGFAVRMMRDV